MSDTFKAAQEKYTEATNAFYAARRDREEATKELYIELLAQKGLKEERPCRIVDKKGKHVKGVFRVVVLRGDSVALRFFPYKNDATLSNAPKAFHFGCEPNVNWEDAGISSIVPCEAPVPAPEDEEG